MMTFLQNLGTVLNESLKGTWGLFASFLPTLLLAIVLLIVGLYIASIVGKAIESLIAAIKLDKLFQSAGAEEVLNRMGIKLNTGKFFGIIVKWFIAIVFLIASLQVVKLTDVSNFIIQLVLLYLPKIIIIIIVLALATIIADAAKKLVLASARAAKITSANILASITKYAVWVIAFVLIAPYLGMDNNLVQIFFAGLVGLIALAGGLAFGLGGKDAASRAIEKISNDMFS